MSLLLALLLLQADDIPFLVERLRSDSVDERTRAEARLKEIGAPALPALRKAATGTDPDQAARARQIVAVLEVREKLSPRLRTSRPGIDERLTVGAPRSWTKELLEILGGKPFPQGGLEWTDVRPLFSSALSGAEGWREKTALLDAVDGPRLFEWMPFAIPFLEDREESVRRTAAGVCSRTGGPDVFRALARLVRRGTPEATETIREALESIPWDAQLEIYLDLVAKAEVVERTDLLALARLASPILTEQLLNRWRADDAVRRPLRAVFRAVDLDAGMPRVTERDHCREVELDECPVKSLLLVDFDPAVSKPAVLAALGSENSYHRRMAAHFSAELGLKEAAAPLRRLLQDPGDGQVRSEAAIAISRLGLRELAPSVAPLLRDEDKVVRGDAAASLGRLGSTDHAASLVELLRDPSDYVRDRAADALGALGAADQSDAILRLLAVEDHAVRRTAARALGRMGRSKALPVIVAALGHADDREAVFEAYGMLGSADDVRKVAALAPPKEAWKDPIGEALWNIGRRDPSALPGLLELLADRAAETRERAARTLARVGAATAADRLAEALGDPEPDVRIEAALALGVLAAKEASGRLEKLLEDPRSDVRRAAAGSLCRLGVRRGVVPLLDVSRGRIPKLTPLNALRNPDEWQRWAGKRLDRPVRGPFKLVLRRLADRAGVKLDYSQVDDFVPDNLWSTAQEGSTLIDALDHALHSASADVILEPGVLKLVLPKDADAFWRKWKDAR